MASIISILGAIASPFTAIVTGIGNYATKKQEISAKKEERKDELTQAIHEAAVEKAKRGDKTVEDYDLQVLKNAASTSMDEIMIGWMLIIVTLLFVPATAPIAAAGFIALAEVPIWFQLIVVGSFISKIGFRFIFTGRTLFGKTIEK
jgi:hypothetical protein